MPDRTAWGEPLPWLDEEDDPLAPPPAPRIPRLDTSSWLVVRILLAFYLAAIIAKAFL